MNTTTSPRKGFTLIELLTVIAIIGILAAILFPVVTGILDLTHRTAAGQNCASVARAYGLFTASTQGRPIFARGAGGAAGTANNINDVAFILAKRAGLNNAATWFIPQDPQLAGAVPQAVFFGEASSATDVSPAFAAAKPKAWAFAAGLPAGADQSTTPLLWTYGLEASGRWSHLSPWSGRGGHVAFLDGHIAWFEEIDATYSPLLTYASNPDGGHPTANIRNALPQGGRVVILNEMGRD